MPTAAIDRTRFAELESVAGADFVAELVETFLAEAPVMLAELRSARTEASAERFRRAAHSLKSNANTFGATALGILARDLELSGLHADPAHDSASIDALEAEYERAAAELKALNG